MLQRLIAQMLSEQGATHDLQTPLGGDRLSVSPPNTLYVPLRPMQRIHLHVFKGEDMKKVSERNIRLTIAMMRSMASCKPISPFHIEASKEMEAMLEELLALRKQLKEKK